MSFDPDELLEELRSVLRRTDPVPAKVTDFAKAALGLRRLDADLAELLADSALEVETATRGTATVRSLGFQATDLAIDVEVHADGDEHTLLGQLAPPAVATIEAQTSEGVVVSTAESDKLGRFRLTLETGGSLRLRIARHDPAGAAIETSWFTL